MDLNPNGMILGQPIHDIDSINVNGRMVGVHEGLVMLVADLQKTVADLREDIKQIKEQLPEGEVK
jgi:hypothetical protein